MTKHGCYNKPRPSTERTYKTWNNEEVKYSMSTDCRYDKSDTDKNCAGCVSAKKPEFK